MSSSSHQAFFHLQRGRTFQFLLQVKMRAAFAYARAVCASLVVRAVLGHAGLSLLLLVLVDGLPYLLRRELVAIGEEVSQALAHAPARQADFLSIHLPRALTTLFRGGGSPGQTVRFWV